MAVIETQMHHTCMHFLLEFVSYRGSMTNTCATRARKRFITECTQIGADVSVAQIAKGSILIAESTMYNSTLTLDISRFRAERLGGAAVSHRFS